MEYRPASREDVPAIAALHAESWRAHYRGEFLDAYLDGDLVGERTATWGRRLEAPSENQLVQLATDGSRLAGFVCAYGAHDRTFGSLIDNLHVSADFQRSGVGSRLMREAGSWLAAAYPDVPVYLLVLESNLNARRFYERLGGRNAQVSRMETNGGAIVRSCHYVWSSAAGLSPA